MRPSATQSQPSVTHVASPLIIACPLPPSGAYTCYPLARASISALRSLRTSSSAIGGPAVAPWFFRRSVEPTSSFPSARLSPHSSPVDSRAARTALRAFDAAARRRARAIAVTSRSAASALAAHAALRSPDGVPLAFPSVGIGGLALRHGPFRRRFARRLRHGRTNRLLHEFNPRGLVPSSMDDAISRVSLATGMPASCLAAAVRSARAWTQPAPYTSSPRGSVPVPSGLSVPAILALDAAPDVTSYLLSTAVYGASTLSACPVSRSYRDNHASAYALPSEVDDLVAKRSASGWLIDVTALYTADPLLPIYTSPIGVIEKSTPGKYRLLLDGSSGVADCVNDFADPSVLPTPVLATFDAIIGDILRLRSLSPGVDILLYTTDIDNAYMRVPVRVDDWWQLGQLWRGRVFWNVSPPMGLRPSGHILGCFTEPINARIAALSGYRPRTYVDDSLGAAPAPDMPLLEALMESVPAGVGFPLSSSKRAPPATSVTFCGWVFDSRALTVSLPPAKLRKLRALVGAHHLRHRIPATALSSLVGALTSACRGLRASRPYLDALSDASSSSSGRWVTLPLAARDDLAYWHDLLVAFDGVSFMSKPAPCATIFADASTSTGWGWVCHDLGVYGSGVWSDEPDIAPPLVHINALELVVGVAASVAVSRLLPPSSSVALRSDNTVAVSSIERERGARGPLANAVRALSFLSDTRPFSVFPSHIQGIRNCVADALSRGTVPASISSYRRLQFPSQWLTQIALSRRPSRDLDALRG